MFQNGKILMAQSASRPIYMLPNMANRHGLIAGATGTGKTVTMKVMAESFSDMGVPVFMADVKGDLSGMCTPGTLSSSVQERAELFGITDFELKGFPTRFWDLFGEEGTPVRVTVSDMGPTLLARLLDLTDVQAGVLNIVFRVADENGLLLLDLKDLRSMLAYVGENRAEFTVEYGNVSAASIGAIQRALLAFEEEGGTCMFGEPALDIKDFIRTDINGRGIINILSSRKLIQSPTCYSMFLLWMLSELYEKLPEVGDLDKPRFVFFFDEAHLLFTDAPKALVNKITQIVKLIRSKGVGIYFVSQSPRDIPDEVLAQLSNRVQHALRAYTPGEQKALKAAADGFRANPAFDTIDVLTNLGVGEALVSFLDDAGIPEIVEASTIIAPQSRMGEADEADIQKAIVTSEFDLKYRESVDRESAYEILNAARIELQRVQAEAEAVVEEAEPEVLPAEIVSEVEPEPVSNDIPAVAAAKAKSSTTSKSAKAASFAKKSVQKAANSAASSVSRSISTNLVNSLMGGKKVNAKTMTKRAATNALSSVMRSGASEILRGLFGTKK